MLAKRRRARQAVEGLIACALVLAAGLAAARADTASDERIKQRVTARLAGQVKVHIEGLGIQVQDGAVRLTGSVSSLGERNRAERLVSGIVGVAGVQNEVAIRRSDRSEIAITQDVQRRLETRTRFRRSPIQVTVVGTEVALDGVVERALDRLDAEEIASETPGVTNVANNLTIRSEGAVPAEAIRNRVLSILTNPLTFGVIRRLEVGVDGSVVTLRGTAAREADRLQAERLALGVPGVSGVINQISVQGSR